MRSTTASGFGPRAASSSIIQVRQSLWARGSRGAPLALLTRAACPGSGDDRRSGLGNERRARASTGCDFGVTHARTGLRRRLDGLVRRRRAIACGERVADQSIVLGQLQLALVAGFHVLVEQRCHGLSQRVGVVAHGLFPGASSSLKLRQITSTAGGASLSSMVAALWATLGGGDGRGLLAALGWSLVVLVRGVLVRDDAGQGPSARRTRPGAGPRR